MIFGHQADGQTNDDGSMGLSSAPAASSFIVGSQPTDAADSSIITPAPTADDATVGAPVDNTSMGLGSSTPEPTTEPVPESLVEDEAPALPASTPADDTTMTPATDTTMTPATDDAFAPSAVPAGSDDLLALKQQALSDLSPLLGHLDQTPEEKFRTLMMLIQTTDNQALIKEAYAAAHAIPDENVKAQALLDVVNEINYFTQQAGGDQQPE